MTVDEKTGAVIEGHAVPEEVLVEEDGSTSAASSGGYSEKMTKRLVRKIDLHILPVLVVLYLLSFLDRTNIGNARLANLEVDLNMHGLNYNVRTMLS